LTNLPSDRLAEIEETLSNLLRSAKQAAELNLSSERSTSAKQSISSDAHQRYEKLYSSVKNSCTQLRVILESTEAKQHEREWLKNQLSGDIDDQRLVDGITGEGRIYRKRGSPEKKHGLRQSKPKRLAFLLDCSASMARMSQWDGRLDRMASCAVMIMEGLSGFEDKFEYTIVGHR
jgi:von Willebrand factor A domain-containing protein 8